MNIKKIFAAAIAGVCLLQMPCVYAAYETGGSWGILHTPEEVAEMGIKDVMADLNVSDKFDELSKRYPYGELTHEEVLKIVEEIWEAYPNTDGLAINQFNKNDKNYYADAGIYNDWDAALVGDAPKFSETKIMVNGEEYKGTIFKSRALASTEVFEVLGCEVNFDEESYVLTISKDGNVLELVPYTLAMRKNKEDGQWIPLEICARFFGEESAELNVPVRAIAEELGLTVEWDNDNRAVVLKN